MHHAVRVTMSNVHSLPTCRPVTHHLKFKSTCKLTLHVTYQTLSFSVQEDNWYPKDLSSTEPYQRDNFVHFLL